VPSPVIDPVAMMDVIRLIVDKGADVNARLKGNTDSYGATTWLVEGGATALLRAAFCGDLEVMKLLMAHGADPLLTTNDGTTTLMALAGVGYGDGFRRLQRRAVGQAMKLLLDAGVPINAMTKEKITALRRAHKNSSPASVPGGPGADLRTEPARGNFEHEAPLATPCSTGPRASGQHAVSQLQEGSGGAW
jgi:ankyrin repeat protein